MVFLFLLFKVVYPNPILNSLIARSFWRKFEIAKTDLVQVFRKIEEIDKEDRLDSIVIRDKG